MNVWGAHSNLVCHPTPPAEANNPYLPGRVGMCLQIFYCSDKITQVLLSIKLLHKRTTNIWIIRCSTKRRQSIRSNSQKAFQGDASSNIFDMRNKTIYFLNNNYSRQPNSVLRLGKMCDNIAFFARILNIRYFKAWIIFWNM